MHHTLGHHTVIVLAIAAVAATWACSSRQGPTASIDPEESALADRMERHFDAGETLRDGVIGGQLDGREEAVAWLVDPRHKELSPESWDPWVDTMQAAAAEAAAAPSAEAMGPAVGTIALACGSCHAQERVQITVIAPAVPEGEGLEDEMHRHAWGAERMWEGLIGPNDDAWRSGVIAVGDGLDPALLAGDDAEMASDVAILAERVQELAIRGEEAETLEARAVVYGEVLQTCANCHDFMGVGD